MKNWSIAIGIFVAAFAVAAACRKKKRSRIMTFRELYEDNGVELGKLING